MHKIGKHAKRIKIQAQRLGYMACGLKGTGYGLGDAGYE
jgi:hypothetical protein